MLRVALQAPVAVPALRLMYALAQLRMVMLVASVLLRLEPSVLIVVGPVMLLDALVLLRVELLLPLVVLPVVLLAMIVRAPMQIYWRFGEAAASTDLHSATLARVSAMCKQTNPQAEQS